MDDGRGLSAAEQGRAMAAGRLDPRGLTEAYLAAIGQAADADRIYARPAPERARTEAAAARDRLRRGMGAGPLDGVPVSWKDNIDSAGLATEGGTRLLAGRVPERDAPVLANATAAGLVCLGKTHLSELAFSGLGVNPMTATPPNALDPDLAPGGSSSGAAVSVALGLASAAIGSDTGGSVRIPAAWNGLVGLRTTPGAVPAEGVIPLAQSFDTVGPLARCVEDAALLFAVLSGQGPAPKAEPGALAFRIAETAVLDDVDPGIMAAFEAALARVTRAGARIGRGAVPEFAEAVRVMAEISPVVTGEAWRNWGAKIEASPGTMWDRIEARFALGRDVPPDCDAEALSALGRLGAALSAEIARTGPLLMPTTPNRPPETRRLIAEESHYVAENLMALRNTRLANVLGLPALTLPLPEPFAGLMIVGSAGSDADLLAIGAALEPHLAG